VRKSVSASGTLTLLACAGFVVLVAALGLQVAAGRPEAARAVVPGRTATSSPTIAPSATVAIATATVTVEASVTPTAEPTPEGVPWNEALLTHLTTTVCSVEAWAPDPLPAWCGSLASVVRVGDQLVVRSTLTPADEEQVGLMGRGLSSFVYNNVYKHYGIRRILIVGDADGATLYERGE